MSTKIVSAITTSAAVTFSLLFIMQALIDLQPGVIKEPREPTMLAWVRPMPPEPPPKTIDQAPTKEFIEPPIVPPRPPTGEKEGYKVAVKPTAAPPTGYRYDGPGSAWSDGPLISLIRVTPNYPGSALIGGLEGYAIVQFDVLADGSVTNVSIVESSDKVFERSSIEAAKRFRFKPRVVEGVPQITAGLQNLFTYEMNK
jgi:protein TonB